MFFSTFQAGLNVPPFWAALVNKNMAGKNGSPTGGKKRVVFVYVFEQVI